MRFGMLRQRDGKVSGNRGKRSRTGERGGRVPYTAGRGALPEKLRLFFPVFLDSGAEIWYATKEPRRTKAFRAERIEKWRKKRNGN